MALKLQATAGGKRSAVDLTNDDEEDEKEEGGSNKRRKIGNSGAGAGAGSASTSSSSSLSRQVIDSKDQRLVKVKSELSEARGSARGADLRADRAEDQTKCTICLDNGRQVCFLPCKHTVTCGECAEAVDTCPVCRQPIAEKMRIFLS